MARTSAALPRDTHSVVPVPLSSLSTPAAANAPTLLLPLTASLVDGVTIPSGVLTAARGTAAWYPNEQGVYSQKTGNTLDFNSLGVFIEPARVNSATNFNAAPAVDASITLSGGTLSVINDNTALALSGLGNICSAGNAYDYTNNTGSTQTVTIASAANAGGTCSIRAFCKVPDGSLITMQTSDGAHLGARDIAPTGGIYLDVRGENIALVVANSNQVFSVPAGHAFRWVLNQFEVGANTTTPMVTAGGAFTRNVTSLTLPNLGNIPSNDFCVYLEVTAYGIAQESSSPVYFSAFQDANNSYQIGGGPPGTINKKVAGVVYTTTVKSVPQLETQPILARFSANEGISCFFGGSRGQARFANFDALTLTSANAHIGRKGDGAQVFTGRIRNVKIFSSALSDRNCIRLTMPSTWDITFVPNMGVPCYGPNNRLYSIKYNAVAGTWADIYYSDTNGDSWQLFIVTAGQSSQETICCDRAGNIYYANSLALKRIDAVTKVETTACTFVANTTGAGAGPGVTPGGIGAVWGWLNWHFTEDNAGNIYIGQYQTAQLGGQFMWKSPVGGNAFTRIDTLVDGVWAGYNTERHIHNLKCNPYDDTIYVSMGDGANRCTFKVTNKFVVGTVAGDCTTVTDAYAGAAPGPTGITFTSEGVYLGTDGSGSQNYVASSVAGAATVARFQFQNPLQITPIFWLAACGKNEMWAVATEDAVSTKNQWSAIIKLVKTDGIGTPWQVARVITLDSARFNGNSYYQMAVTSRGIIPEGSKYLYVLRRKYASTIPSGDLGYFRIAR